MAAGRIGSADLFRIGIWNAAVGAWEVTIFWEPALVDGFLYSRHQKVEDDTYKQDTECSVLERGPAMHKSLPHLVVERRRGGQR